MNIPKELLQPVYESHGLVFRDGNVILNIGPSTTLAVDENIFLEPTEEGIKSLQDTISREIDIEWELFDVTDKRFEMTASGNWQRAFGRVYHHQEWVCCPARQRKYYTYVTMSAPMSAVSADSWEKMAIYLVCVLATLGILVLLGIITSGMSVAATTTLFGAIAGSCVVAMLAVTGEHERAAAHIHTHVGR